MKEIVSLSNNLVKETVKLQQKKYRNNLILIEGKKSVEEAVCASLEIEYIFVSNEELYKKYEKYDTYLVNEPILKKVSTTESAPEIICVAKKPNYKICDFKSFNKIVLLDSIKDAGNFGTIIRCASALGVDGILLYGQTTDEFSPKTIRSSAGNMFKLPILKVSIDELNEFKKTHKLVSTVVNSENDIKEYKIKDKTIIMFGSEADGLCKELLNITDDTITIKMTNEVESLNLAMSVGIILWELQK